MSVLTPSEVEAAEARAKALPVSVWTLRTNDDGQMFIDMGAVGTIEIEANFPSPAREIAYFLTRAHADVPRLCEALREAWADNAWMRQEWEACVERDKASFEEVKDRRAERDALKERILALENQAALYSASLKKADAENERLREALEYIQGHSDTTGQDGFSGEHFRAGLNIVHGAAVRALSPDVRAALARAPKGGQ